MREDRCRSALGDPPPQRVAILRALQLGDLLCTVPALRALRGALPQAEIVLIGLPWAREFAQRFSAYLDGFRAFPGFPGLPERSAELSAIPHFLAAMQAERFDLLLQLHGSGTVTNPLAALMGARVTAGFYVPGAYCPDPARFLPYPQAGLELQRLLRLLEFLGIAPRGEHLEFPVWQSDEQALQALRNAGRLPHGRYACIHPGASTSARRWPVDRFAAVADALGARGLSIVLTGTAAEAHLTGAVVHSSRASVFDLAGHTTLGVLAALMRAARLLVCNDTGVSHLAAALGTASVVISTGDNPLRWAPLDRTRHRVLCRDAGVTAVEVVRAADSLLQEKYVNPLPSLESSAIAS